MTNTKLKFAALLVEHYIQFLLRKGYSESTMRIYRMNLEELVRFLHDDEKLDDFKHVDREVLWRYQGYLYDEKRGLSIRTQSLRLVTLKGFFKWLEREGILFCNPAEKIAYPRKPKQLPRDIFSEEEIRRLMNAVEIDSKLGLRDKAILELLYTSAIRSGELCNLTISDIQAEDKTLTVRAGKGNKDRVVPISEVAIAYIQEYLKFGRKQFKNAENLPWFFVSLRGTKMEGRNIAPIVQKYAARAGLTRYTSAHMIRHSTATHMLRHGAPIRVLQEFLGHKKLDTTQLYAQVEIVDLKKVHSKCHPREIGLQSDEEIS